MMTRFLFMSLICLALTACDNNDNDDSDNGSKSTSMSSSSSDSSASSTSSSSHDNTVSYTITVHNSTANQPLSPVALLVHSDAHQAWRVGEAASMGLEKLAESGMTDEFIAEAGTHLADDLVHATTGAGVILPGESESFYVTLEQTDNLHLTVATMLVNTNDAFAGLQNLNLDKATVDYEYSMSLAIYDAGTEANSESAESIPGPAASGEGFNSERDDADFVAMHPGIVSADDGLATSALKESHRFMGQSVTVSVTMMP